MKFIFLRHGTAEPKSPNHTELQDSERELVKAGRKEIKKLLKKNAEQFEDIDMIFSSPYLRAVETAELVYKKCLSDSFELLHLLEPNVSPKDFVDHISMKNDPKVLFVGHEPGLSNIVKKLLKSPDMELEIAKGGAVVLEGKSVKNMKLVQVLKP